MIHRRKANPGTRCLWKGQSSVSAYSGCPSTEGLTELSFDGEEWRAYCSEHYLPISELYVHLHENPYWPYDPENLPDGHR